MRAPIGYAAALGSLLSIATLAACGVQNLGEPPPSDQFFFPSGVLLDPVQRDASVEQCPGYVSGDPDSAQGVPLPPATLEMDGPRYLYVANGNNDRTFNAGTLMAIDLRAFWRSWYDPQRDDPAQAECLEARAASAANDGDVSLRAAACDACLSRDPLRGGVDPYCHEGLAAPTGEAFNRCVKPPGVAVDTVETLAPDDTDETPASPCRRLPLLNQVVECDETPFVADVVRLGDFATTLTHSFEDDALRLWLPVRGDPSVTYVDVHPNGDGICFDCSDGTRVCDAGPADRACGDSHRLDLLRNDPDLDTLDREPFNALIWEHPEPSEDPQARGQRLAFVAHASGTQLSMVDLDGVRGGNVPAIVDLAPIYITGVGGAGGFGLARRPCFEGGQGPLGMADLVPNIPTITQGCTRPLIYTSFRFAGQLASFTASGLDLGRAVSEAVPPADRTDCMVALRNECQLTTETSEGRDTQTGEGEQILECNGIAPSEAGSCSGGGCRDVFAGPYCATPDQLGQPCAVECEPQVRGTRRILPSLLLDTSGSFSPILGDMAFADSRGDQLLVLQTNPGALLSLDTSLGEDGEPLDIPSAPPVEICAEPSRMKIHIELDATGAPAQRYALITCFRAALVYVVDLESLRVVDAIVVGTGPHDIAIDSAREVAYVINNLEFSLSVIDLSRRRSTRFQELARLGLQDPFS